MNSFFIAFLASLGVSVWVYTKVYKSSGNNQNAVIAAAIAAVINFIFIISTLSLL